MNKRFRDRRGLGVVEWFVILGVGTLATFLIVSNMGTSVRDDMDQTAGEIGDLSQLTKRFGNDPGGSGGSSAGGEKEGTEETEYHTVSTGDTTPDSGDNSGGGDAYLFSDTGDKDKGPKGDNGVGNGEDPPPPGNPRVNDGLGTSPGNPGNKGGSDQPSTKGNNGVGNGEDPPPPGNPKVNDGPGASPGNPDSKGGGQDDGGGDDSWSRFDKYWKPKWSPHSH